MLIRYLRKTITGAGTILVVAAVVVTAAALVLTLRHQAGLFLLLAALGTLLPQLRRN